MDIKYDSMKNLSHIVREHNKDPRLNTLGATAITSETELVWRKNIDDVSYTIHLSLPMKRVRDLKGRMQLLYGSVIFI
ncbi:hypothetical protein CFP56_041855 [Quercus suber]|uniref:Uncharacterized protein n=1 Tax=Quercus suber TaxID=58331 RepID=A0AAW0IUM2_QUESU